MQDKIKNLIKDALTKLDIEEVDFVVEHPEDKRLPMGDYSTNVAFIYAKKTGEDLLESAQKIARELQKVDPDSGIDMVTVDGPGFINFHLSQEFFAKNVKEVIENKNFGENSSLKGKKIIVEHTDPNLFKEFHIGHLMPNVVGSTLARLFEWSGANVKQICYQGDVGMHIAKTIWGLKGEENPGESKTANGKRLGLAYAKGSKAYDEDEKAREEIIKLNKKIYQNDPEITEIYNIWRQASLEYFDEVYGVLKTNFDKKFFESETAPIGEKIVRENIPKIFEESDGAIVFKAEKYDSSLHTRVFLNSEGLPTYETKELGLAVEKEKTYKPDLSIVVTGNEINNYFNVLLCAMKQIFPEIADKTKHISHGMLRLPTGKMSSRKGDVITFWGMDGIYQKVIDQIFNKVDRQLGRTETGDKLFASLSREINQTYGPMALGAIKYMILRQSIGGDIIFDVEKSVSTEGDSGVYLQYASVRAKSLLQKAKEESVKGDAKLLKDWQTIELEKLLYQFPEVVLRSAQEFQPHHIVSYLTELARSFNSFYGNTKIIDKNDATSAYKIALTEAFSIVMKNGLYVLGIETPERM